MRTSRNRWKGLGSRHHNGGGVRGPQKERELLLRLVVCRTRATLQGRKKPRRRLWPLGPLRSKKSREPEISDLCLEPKASLSTVIAGQVRRSLKCCASLKPLKTGCLRHAEDNTFIVHTRDAEDNPRSTDTPGISVPSSGLSTPRRVFG